jgi:hypothetical protein
MRNWRWMARRRWRRARAPMSVCVVLASETLPRPSSMGGRFGSTKAPLIDGGMDVMVETEPRGRVKSKPGGAMKSSASTPGAIWRLPRLDVGLLRAVGVVDMSALGPKGECHAGNDILRPTCAGEPISSGCGCVDIGPGILESSGAISSFIFSLDLSCERCSLTAFSTAPRSAELCADISVLDERSLSWPNTRNS